VIKSISSAANLFNLFVNFCIYISFLSRVSMLMHAERDVLANPSVCLSVCLSVRPSDRLSVRLSHSGIVS